MVGVLATAKGEVPRDSVGSDPISESKKIVCSGVDKIVVVFLSTLGPDEDVSSSSSQESEVNLMSDKTIWLENSRCGEDSEQEGHTSKKEVPWHWVWSQFLYAFSPCLPLLSCLPSSIQW